MPTKLPEQVYIGRKLGSKNGNFPEKGDRYMTNRVCVRITIYLLIAVAAFAVAPPVLFAGISTPSAASTAASSNPTVLPPAKPPYGRTYADWSVLWWQWFLPLTQTQISACTIGQSAANVAFLWAGPHGCLGTISSHTSLFFPIGNVDCSSLEASPFFGATPTARDSCAFTFFTQLSTGTVEIDAVRQPNYPTKSPDFTFTVGSDNVFGITCNPGSCTGQATGYGYYLMLAPLPIGTHTIHILATDYGIDTTWTINVQ
jgi:hypothetical protein